MERREGLGVGWDRRTSVSPSDQRRSMSVKVGRGEARVWMVRVVRRRVLRAERCMVGRCWGKLLVVRFCLIY